MSFDNLKMFPKNRIKSLFGLEPEVLAEVIFRVLPVLEKNRADRLRNNPERKRRYVKKDGRPPELLPIHKLLMTLLYCAKILLPRWSGKCLALVPMQSRRMRCPKF